MESDIIYNSSNAHYDHHEIASQHHHHVQHTDHTMVAAHQEHHHMVNHDHEPITTSASNTYTGSCWQFMPPDYPYCSEDDFRYVATYHLYGDAGNYLRHRLSGYMCFDANTLLTFLIVLAI